MDGQSCGSFHIKPATDATYETSLDLRELVLDVPRGSAVLLSTKVRLSFLSNYLFFFDVLWETSKLFFCFVNKRGYRSRD